MIFILRPVLYRSSNQGEEGWAGHFGRMGEKGMQGLVVKPRGKNRLENLGVDGRIMSLEIKW